MLLAAGGALASPPDGRGYELVTPPDKLGAIPNFPGGQTTLGFLDFGTVGDASVDGNHVIWFSTAAFGDVNSAIPMNYESSRTAAGWQTKQASPDPTEPHPNVFLSISNITDATDDFSTRIVKTSQEYDPLNQGLFRSDLYAQDASGNLTWLSRADDGSASSSPATAEYVGRDADASHILFRSREALVPAAVGQVAADVYDRTGGHTVLVNVDSGGTPIGQCGAALGLEPPVGSPLAAVSLRAVSQDGSHIFFTTPNGRGSGDPSCDDPPQLYVRLDGTTTAHVSASQRTIADPGGTQAAAFQGASVDGSTVYFLSPEALTNSAADGDGSTMLYKYDVPSGQLTLLSPNSSEDPDVMGVVAVSNDGSRLYFVARGVLAPGATAGVPNLYTYAGGQTTLIATIDNASPLVAFEDYARQVRMTDDGSRIVFPSMSNLTSYDSGGFQELYLYDTAAPGLQCVSCPSDGVPASGNAFTSEDGLHFFRTLRPRNLVDDGHRLFFESPEALVPQDDNRVLDVYEWHDGSVQLISGGHGNDGSYFMDTSNNGADVFFVTADRLAAQDTDGDLDIYDARVGGGFPVPPSAGATCVDDQCQGQPSAPPSLPGVASGTDFGPGNVTPGHRARLSIRAIGAKARHRLARTGRLSLVANVGRAGVVRGSASAVIGGKMTRVAHEAVHARHGGTVRLRLQLSRAAMARLASGGRLKVTIVVTFPGAVSRKATLVLAQSAQAQR